MAWAPGATVFEISTGWALIAAVSACGRTRAAVLPRSGQTAPNMQADRYLFVARRAWAGAAIGPDTGQGALSTDPGFILEPDFEWPATHGLGQGLVYVLREVFSNASCAAGSD